MKRINAREAKNAFGKLMSAVMREPVMIEKNGSEHAVMMSVVDYKRLEALEDLYWGMRADEAAKDVPLSAEESDSLLRDMLS